MLQIKDGAVRRMIVNWLVVSISDNGAVGLDRLAVRRELGMLGPAA